MKISYFLNQIARELLSERGVIIEENFKILENSSGGLMDYYHTFELEISPSDKKNLIKQILNSNDYKDSISEEYSIISEMERHSKDKISISYQIPNSYVKEIYETHGENYVPTHDIISISKSENKVIFERIEN